MENVNANADSTLLRVENVDFPLRYTNTKKLSLNDSSTIQYENEFL